MADRIIYTRKPLGADGQRYAYEYGDYAGPTYDVHYRDQLGAAQFNSRPMTAFGAIWATDYLLGHELVPATAVDVRLHA